MGPQIKSQEIRSQELKPRRKIKSRKKSGTFSSKGLFIEYRQGCLLLLNKDKGVYYY